MCIIAAKPQGVKPPSMDVFEECFINNAHGAGFMVLRPDAKTIDLQKGFMKFEDFKKAYKKAKITEDDQAVFHFRISTSGLIDQGNCHPYIVSDKDSQLRQTKARVRGMAFAHNGVISELNGVDKKLNDTQLFAKWYLSDPVLMNNIFDSSTIQDLVEGYIGSSKFAIMQPGKTMLLLGKFIEDEGMLYSNSTYERPKYMDYGYGYGGWYGNNKKKKGKLGKSTITVDNNSYNDYDYGYGWEDDYYQQDAKGKVASSEYQDEYVCDWCGSKHKATRWSMTFGCQICKDCEDAFLDTETDPLSASYSGYSYGDDPRKEPGNQLLTEDSCDDCTSEPRANMLNIRDGKTKFD